MYHQLTIYIVLLAHSYFTKKLSDVFNLKTLVVCFYPKLGIHNRNCTVRGLEIGVIYS